MSHALNQQQQARVPVVAAQLLAATFAMLMIAALTGCAGNDLNFEDFELLSCEGKATCPDGYTCVGPRCIKNDELGDGGGETPDGEGEGEAPVAGGEGEGEGEAPVVDGEGEGEPPVVDGEGEGEPPIVDGEGEGEGEL